jgi:Na+/proline symporter
MNNPMSNLDWAIIAIYLLAMVGLGMAAGLVRRKGRRGGDEGRYFLAGNTLAWPVIGLAMFAANISTVHLVSLAEAAYKYGLVFGIYHGDFMLIAFLLLVVCLGIMMATSFMFPKALKPEAETLVRGNCIEPLQANCGSGLSDCRIISTVILVAFVVLHLVLR